MYPQALTEALKKDIKKEYDNGSYSPLQLAYKFNVEVDQVLESIDQADLNEVHLSGDQIDDAGPGVEINRGSKQKVKFTKN